MLEFRELEKYELESARKLYYESFKREVQPNKLEVLGTLVGLFLNKELIGLAQIDYINNNFENCKTAYLNSFCIKEKYRHLGYGTKLLEKCIKLVKNNGSNLINLTSNKNRVYAHMLYKAQGFTEVETILLKKEL